MLQLGIKLEKCYFGELGIGKRHMGNFGKEIQNQEFWHNTFAQFSAFMLFNFKSFGLLKNLKTPLSSQKFRNNYPNFS